MMKRKTSFQQKERRYEKPVIKRFNVDEVFFVSAVKGDKWDPNIRNPAGLL